MGDVFNMKTMEIANLTCKSISGKEELLDVFLDYFYNAMLTQEVKGSKNSETHKYKFIDLEITTINNELVLLGRLVKCLNIQREQILEGKTIVKSYDEMASAPTSFFVLILSNHKLLWVREVSRAPMLRDLKYALLKAVNQERELLISNKINQLIECGDDEYMAGKKAYDKYPKLEIEITPLGNNASIRECLNDFAEIYNFNVMALKRNNELGSDYNDLLRNLSSSQENMQAKNVSVNIHGDKKHPLVKEQAINLAQTASDGNYKYKISGIDTNNNPITKDQNSFSLTAKISYSENVVSKFSNALNMIKKYFNIVELYNNLPSQNEDNYNKLQKIREEFGK